MIFEEFQTDYELHLLRARLSSQEEQLERDWYIIDALVEKIRVLEEKIFDLEN